MVVIFGLLFLFVWCYILSVVSVESLLNIVGKVLLSICVFNELFIISILIGVVVCLVVIFVIFVLIGLFIIL